MRRTPSKRTPLLLALGALAASALGLDQVPRARAHGPEPKAEREIVRLQGYRDARPEGAAVSAQITIDVFGVEHRFLVTDWQQLGLSEPAKGGKPDARIALQGDRATLARIGDARPGQRITLLAERRLGSTDLFILALDLCPER